RHDPRARLGNALEPGQVLQTRNVRSGDETMHGEVARGAVVDRGRVEADRADAPFPDEKAYRLRAERREVQVRGVARGVVSQVSLPVGPALAPAGAQENDRAARDGAVSLLPPAHVGEREPVVRVPRRGLGDVDQGGWRDEL